MIHRKKLPINSDVSQQAYNKIFDFIHIYIPILLKEKLVFINRTDIHTCIRQ